MCAYQCAGAMLRLFREQAGLSQEALSIKTQLVDVREKRAGISASILSGIETGKRVLSVNYLALLSATGIFSRDQIEQLRQQAIADMIRHKYGEASLSPHTEPHIQA